MTKVQFSNPPSFTTRSILALPVKWGTLNLPPLIASTSGKVDQIRCLTPAPLAARMAVVAYSISLVPASPKLVTRKTPCAPSKAALSVSGLSKSASTTSSASSRCLSGLRVSARTLNCPLACSARRTPPPCCPVAPITAINFLLFMTRSLYCLSIRGPLNLSAKNKLIQVDRNDQWFGCGTAVWLTRENPSLSRKDDAGELFEIGDVMCGRRTAADLDVVIVSLQQSLLIEVQCLFCAVGRDIRGEVNFQTTPRFACFLPRLDFFGFHVGSREKERSIQIRPHRASGKIGELQIAPRCFESVSLERRPGLQKFFKYLTVRVLQRDPLRFEARPPIGRAEGIVRSFLVAKVDSDCHFIEHSGFALCTPEYATIDSVDRKRGETVPAFKATVGFDCQLREIRRYDFSLFG